MSAISLISPPSCFTGTLTFRQLYIYQDFSGQNTICLDKELILGFTSWLHLCYDQFYPLETGLHLSLQVNHLCWTRSPLPDSVALEASPAVSVLPFLCQQQLQSLKWSFRPPAWLPEIKHTPKIYKASLEESCAEVLKKYVEFSDSHKYPAAYYKGWVQFKEHTGNKRLFKWMCQDLPGILRAIQIHNLDENSRSLWAVP